MKLYTVIFLGRKRGSNGKFSRMPWVAFADSMEQARNEFHEDLERAKEFESNGIVAILEGHQPYANDLLKFFR
jgi:hypothetical protein